MPGVNISGLIFDAGPVSSPALLRSARLPAVGRASPTRTSVDDVFFRVGGEEAGSAQTASSTTAAARSSTTCGPGAPTTARAPGLDRATADTGVVVDGNDVTAYGLAVEHYQKYETVWNGQHGTVVFFQNENPYEVPDQAAWMASPTQDGYPAFYIPKNVTSFQGYGMGSYSYFNQGVAIENSMAFEAPSSAGSAVPRPPHRVPQRLRRNPVGDQRDRRGRELDLRRAERRGQRLLATR